MNMDWDFIVIGSGFGGSVSALRLVEKGYRVLMLEQGRRRGPADLPKTNWDLERWFWLPQLGLRGIFTMTFLRHLTVLSGAGVGGGSLVYAAALPTPKDDFFSSPSWGHLADWKTELAPHYETARRMLGVAPNPHTTYPDEVVHELAVELGREDSHQPTEVGIYFGEPDVTVPDPFFDGEGPDRTGCTLCGGCMVGCRPGAKNSLDKNYLYLAEKRGLVLQPDTEVTWVQPLDDGGYRVDALEGASVLGRRKRSFRAARVIFSAGALGTQQLLGKLRESPDGLPQLSSRLGQFVRINSEVLSAIVSPGTDRSMSKGVAITSIFHTDDHSHLEPVRYSEGSGFFRAATMPLAPGDTIFQRLRYALGLAARHPMKTLRALLVDDWAKHTMVVLYMRTVEGYVSLERGRSLMTGFRRGLTSRLAAGSPPTNSLPEATALIERLATKIDGYPTSIISDSLLGTPSTAHILGGCVMGEGREHGVIDSQHRAFGYDGLYVIDGSAISANVGVNPSLTICALAERAMSFIPAKPSHEADPVEA